MTFQDKSQQTTLNYNPDALTKALRYQWRAPQAPQAWEHEAYWAQDTAYDAVTELTQQLLEHEWRVDFIRSQTKKLGASPKGRRRAVLMKQLISVFLDPERLMRSFQALDAKNQQAFAHVMLYHNLQSLQTSPYVVKQFFRSNRELSAMKKEVLDAGLGLQDDMGNLLLPFEMLRLLPALYIIFPVASQDPETFIPAPDPHFLATQIQQWLSTVQTGHYQLRARPRWSPPPVAYMGNYQVWPPTPEYAKKLEENNRFQGAIDLCSPVPAPDNAALKDWHHDLGLSQDLAEFIYHVMLMCRVVLKGSPITLDEKMAQRWLMQTPGKQIQTLYQFHRGLSDWAAWWSLWRSGDIHVRWNYQNYWQVTSIDDILQSSNYLLRWVILDTLALLPHDVWLSFDQAATLLTDLYPDPKAHRYQSNLLLKGPSRWKGFLSMVLKAMLTGPLHVMGFVDIAPDRDNLSHFRLHHLQDAHWERLAEVPSTTSQTLEEEALRYQAEEKQLLVTPPASPNFLAFVQLWARPAGLANNILRYQLDLARLHDAFEQGETPETLAQAWETHTEFAPLPEIRAWWDYWWERYGHVRIYAQQATLMTRDDFTMQELQSALPTLRDNILGLVTPRVALLQPEHVDKILSDLERQGYMPKEEA